MFSRAPHRFLMSFRSRIWLYRLKNAVFLWVATMIQTLPGTYWKNCPKRTILLQHLLLIEVAVFICNSGNWKYQNLVKHTSIPYFFILVQGSLWLVRLIFFHFMFWLLFTRYFFCHDLLSSPFFFSLLVVTHIRGHIEQALLPPRHYARFVPCISIARRFELFLPSSTRIELCLSTLGALSSSRSF